MDFDETRLNLGIDLGTLTTYQFATSIVVAGDGSEQRRINATQPLARYQIGDRTLSKTDLDYLRNFHANREGRLNGFRFKDWADWYAEAQPLGTGDGSEQTYQLTKHYTISGTWGSYTVQRPITKPVADTVVLYVDGVEADPGDWSIDTTTGVVTASLDGVITADFEFDVPVRFEQDAIAFTLDAYQDTSTSIHTLKSVSLLEWRLPLAPVDNPVPIPTPPKLISQELGLGIDLDTEGSPAYSTSVLNIGAGYESREANWSQSRARFSLAQRTLNTTDLAALIAWFRCTHGAAITFYYRDRQRNALIPVRFDEDLISFQFDAYESPTRAIWRLNALSLIETIFPNNNAIVFGPQTGGNIWIYLNFVGVEEAIQGGIVSGETASGFNPPITSIEFPEQTPGAIVKVKVNGTLRDVCRMLDPNDSGGRWLYWQSGAVDGGDRTVTKVLSVYTCYNADIGSVVSNDPQYLLALAQSYPLAAPALAW